MRVVTKYACETCGNEYDATREAISCEDRGVDAPQEDMKGIVPGTFVTVDHEAWAWRLGPDHWTVDLAPWTRSLDRGPWSDIS